MTTYHDSRIKTASRDYVCGDHLPGRGCGDLIIRGDRYLSFAPGQRGRIPICLNESGQESIEGCAYKRTAFGLKYNCSDMIQHIAREQADKGG